MTERYPNKCAMTKPEGVPQGQCGNRNCNYPFCIADDVSVKQKQIAKLPATDIEWFPVAEVTEEDKDGKQLLFLAYSYYSRHPEEPKIDDPDLMFCVMHWEVDAFQSYYDGTCPKPAFFCRLLESIHPAINIGLCGVPD